MFWSKYFSIITLNLAILVLREANGQTGNKPSPFILIPGMACSEAFITTPTHRKPSQLWASVLYLINFHKLETYFKLSYNNKTRKTTDSKLVNITFPGWGDTKTIENVASIKTPLTDFLGPIVRRMLKNSFYKRNFTLRGAPYDFRRAPNESGHLFKQLKLLVEETYRNAGGRRVMLLSHSMGGLYALYFLTKQSPRWKKKHIRGFIGVSLPVAGSEIALKANLHGYNFNIPLRKPRMFRRMERTFTGLSFVLPHEKFWPRTQPLVVTPRRNYTASDYRALFTDNLSPEFYDMRKDTRALVDPTRDEPGLDEVYCVHGVGVPTVKQLVYTKQMANMFPDGEPKEIYGDGDGTVNIDSLLACRKWPNVKHKMFPKVKHSHVFQNKKLTDYVASIIMKGE